MRFPRSVGPRPAPGPGSLLQGNTLAKQFQQHQRLIDGSHAHPLGDERAEAKEGCRGAGGNGVTVAVAGRPGPVWFWAARPADAPALLPQVDATEPRQPPGADQLSVFTALDTISTSSTSMIEDCSNCRALTVTPTGEWFSGGPRVLLVITVK